VTKDWTIIRETHHGWLVSTRSDDIMVSMKKYNAKNILGILQHGVFSGWQTFNRLSFVNNFEFSIHKIVFSSFSVKFLKLQ